MGLSSASATPGVRLGFVVGLTAEARIAARFGSPVRAGGGTSQGAADAAGRLIADGANALVSFGLAGGLDPALRPGAIVIPAFVLSDGKVHQADNVLAEHFGGTTGHALLAGMSVAADVSAKRHLRQLTGAHALDLESGSVAKAAEAAGVPFVVVRAICDPAERSIPPAALVALDQRGSIGLIRVMASVLRQPNQLPALIRLASDAAAARRALLRLAS
jgi:adenosylhomocysteine nucleosidase